jgi:beta-1,4-mannosyltransferase
MMALRVLFAPDYRAGNPYQELLAHALASRGIDVTFLSDYHRGLPLARGVHNAAPDIVHMHWPEKYFAGRGDSWDRLRLARYPLDLWLTGLRQPIVLTAHNLFPHNKGTDAAVRRNVRRTVRSAKAIFAHGEAARGRLLETFDVNGSRVHVIPFGDHSVHLGPPLPKGGARAKLGIADAAKICLVFGTVSPYKGTDALVRYWTQAALPYRLVVVGPVLSRDFASELASAGAGCEFVDLRLSEKWLDDEELRTWLSAADCTIFNYREIFTSGAAPLARSYGLPLLIPRRLDTVDLDEPHPHVFRFDGLGAEFCTLLERAIATPRDYDLAQAWREQTSWERVAELTVPVYRSLIRGSRS